MNKCERMFRIRFVERRLYCRRYFLRPFRSPQLFLSIAVNRFYQYITTLFICKPFATNFLFGFLCDSRSEIRVA